MKSTSIHHVSFASDTGSPLFSPSNNTISQTFEREIESIVIQSIQDKELNLSNRDLVGDTSLFFSDAIQSAFLRGMSPAFETINLSSCKMDVKGFTSIIDTIIRCCLDSEEIKLKKIVLRKNQLVHKEYGSVIAKLIMEANGTIRELDASDSQLGTGGTHALVSATFASTVVENVNLPIVYSIYQLMILDLSGNNIGDMGVLSICKGMASLVRRHQPISIQILRLNNNGITDHGAQCITQQLMLMISSTVSYATTKVYDHFGLTPSPHQKNYNHTLLNLTSSTLSASSSGSLLISPMTPGTPHPNQQTLSYMKLQELDLDDNNIGVTGMHSLLSILPTYTSLQVLSLARCQPSFTILEILSSILTSNTTSIDFIDLKFTERVAQETIREVRQMQDLSKSNVTNGKVLDQPWSNVMKRLVDGIRRRIYRANSIISYRDSSVDYDSVDDSQNNRIRIHLGALPMALYQHIRNPIPMTDLNSKEELINDKALMNEKIDIATALDTMYMVNEVFRLPNEIQRWITNNHQFPSSTDIALEQVSEDELASFSLSRQLQYLDNSNSNNDNNNDYDSKNNNKQDFSSYVSPLKDQSPQLGNKNLHSTIGSPNDEDSKDFYIGNISISDRLKSPKNGIATNITTATNESSKPTGIFTRNQTSPSMTSNKPTSTLSSSSTTSNTTNSTTISTMSYSSSSSNVKPLLSPHDRAMAAVAQAAENTRATLKASPSPLNAHERVGLSPKASTKSRIAFSFEEFDGPKPPTEPILTSSAAASATTTPKKGEPVHLRDTLSPLHVYRTGYYTNSNNNNNEGGGDNDNCDNNDNHDNTTPKRDIKPLNTTGPMLGGLDVLLLSPSSRLALSTLSQGTTISTFESRHGATTTTQGTSHPDQKLSEATAESTMNKVSDRIISNQIKANEILSNHNSAVKPSTFPYEGDKNNNTSNPPTKARSDISGFSNYSLISIPTGNEIIDKQVQELERIRQEKLAAMRKLAEVAEDLVKSSDSLSVSMAMSVTRENNQPPSSISPRESLARSQGIGIGIETRTGTGTGTGQSTFTNPANSSTNSNSNKMNHGTNTAFQDILDEKTYTYGSSLNLSDLNVHIYENNNIIHGPNSNRSNDSGHSGLHSLGIQSIGNHSTGNHSIGTNSIGITEDSLHRVVRQAVSEELENKVLPLIRENHSNVNSPSPNSTYRVSSLNIHTTEEGSSNSSNNINSSNHHNQIKSNQSTVLKDNIMPKNQSFELNSVHQQAQGLGLPSPTYQSFPTNPSSYTKPPITPTMSSSSMIGNSYHGTSIASSNTEPMLSPLAALIHSIDQTTKNSKGTSSVNESFFTTSTTGGSQSSRAPWNSDTAFGGTSSISTIGHGSIIGGGNSTIEGTPSSRGTKHSPNTRTIRISSPKSGIRIGVELPEIVENRSSMKQSFTQSNHAMNLNMSENNENNSNFNMNGDINSDKMQGLLDQFQYMKTKIASLEQQISEEQINPILGLPYSNTGYANPTIQALANERESLRTAISQVEIQLKKIVREQNEKRIDMENRLSQSGVGGTSNSNSNSSRLKEDEYYNQILSQTSAIPPLYLSQHSSMPIRQESNRMTQNMGTSHHNHLHHNSNDLIKETQPSPLYEALTSLVNESTNNRSVYGSESKSESKSKSSSAPKSTSTSKSNQISITPQIDTRDWMTSSGRIHHSIAEQLSPNSLRELQERMRILETALEAEHESTIKVLEILIDKNQREKERSVSKSESNRRSEGRQSIHPQPKLKPEAELKSEKYVYGQENEYNSIIPSHLDLEHEEMQSYPSNHQKSNKSSNQVDSRVYSSSLDDTDYEQSKTKKVKRSSSTQKLFSSSLATPTSSIPNPSYKPHQTQPVPQSKSLNNDTIRLTTSFTRDHAVQALKNVQSIPSSVVRNTSGNASVVTGRISTGQSVSSSSNLSRATTVALPKPHILPPPMPMTSKKKM